MGFLKHHKPAAAWHGIDRMLHAAYRRRFSNKTDLSGKCLHIICLETANCLLERLRHCCRPIGVRDSGLRLPAIAAGVTRSDVMAFDQVFDFVQIAFSCLVASYFTN